MNPISTLFWSTKKGEKFTVLGLMLYFTMMMGLIAGMKIVPGPVHVWHGIQIESPLLPEDEAIAHTLPMWEREISRRFPDAFVYAIHGTDQLGDWYCQDPDRLGQLMKTRDLALRLKARFPNRVIILIVCNPGGYHLKIPGVYHALESVWYWPDKFRDHPYPAEHDPDRRYVGNIYEFTDQ